MTREAFKEAERQKEIESSPLSRPELRALVDAVSRLAFDDQRRKLCDRTHRFTRFSLQARSVGRDKIDRVISFLESKGFFCDCQVT